VIEMGKPFAALVWIAGLQACWLKPHPATVRPEPATMAIADSVAFSTVLRYVDKEGFDGRPYRIDPRPLLPDPSLISPGLRLKKSGPDSVSGSESVFAEVDTTVLQARKRILEARGIPEADVIRDSRCPGAMAPPSATKTADMQRYCPGEASYSLSVALPRADDSSSLQVWVRVIAISLSRRGATHSSADYVFLREPSGLRFVKRVEIAYIE
jgi:hypothetical protein